MASFAEQGSVVLPQYQSHVQDYGNLYATIGSQLNQQHLANKQAWLTNIIQPLSQIQVRDEDRETFNKIQEQYKSAAEQFEANNDWSKASSFIMDTTADILTNNGLKAMQTAYAQEQEYIKEIRKSKWDLENQNAFILRSKLQSKAIKYNPITNLVEEGGFNPIYFGEPYDVTEYQKELSDIASKMAADKVTVNQIISDPTILAQYGIDSITGLNNEIIASSFIDLAQTTEELTPQIITTALLNLMDSNPEYNNHINAVNTNKLFSKLYTYDNNTKSYKLRSVDITDWVDVVDPSEYTKTAMLAIKDPTGNSFDIKRIGSYDKDGHFIVNPKADKEYIQSINDLYSTDNYDFDIVKILEGKNALPTDILIDLNQDYFSTLYDDNSKDTGISYDDFLQNIILKTMNQNDKYKTASGLGLAHKKYSVTQDLNIVANPMFKYTTDMILTEKKHENDKQLANYKYNLEHPEINNKPILNVAGTVVVSDQLSEVDVDENFNQIKQHENYLTRIQVPIEMEKALGIQQGSLLSELDNLTLDEGLQKIQNDSSLSNEDKDEYVHLFTTIYNSYTQKALLESINDTILGERSDLFSYYLKHGTVETINDWKRKDKTIPKDSISFRTLSLIHNRKITSFEDYKKISGEYEKHKTAPYNFQKKIENYGRQPYYLKFRNEKEFNRFIKNYTKTAKAFINKNRDSIINDSSDNGQWVTQKYVISGSSLSKRADENLETWSSGQSKNFEYEYHGEIPSEKKILKLEMLIGHDARDQKITPSGFTQDLKNKKNNLTFKASEAGLKGDYNVGYTKIQPTMDSQSIKNGYLTYNLNVYDTDGRLRDIVQLKEKVDYTTIRNYITADYDRLKDYAKVKGPDGDNARFMMGIYDTLIAQSDFVITPVKGGDEFKTFDAIEKQVDKNPSTGVEYKFHLRSDPRIEYNVLIKRNGLKYTIEDKTGILNPQTNQVLYNVYGYGSNLTSFIDENNKLSRFNSVEEIFTTLSSIYTLSSLQ